VSGAIFVTGMLVPYMSSYFHKKDPSTRNSDILVLSPISILFETVVSAVAVKLSKRFFSYDCILLGILVSTVLIFLSSYITSSIGFCFLFGAGLGCLSGVTFLPVLMILWNNLKTNSERNTNIVLLGHIIGPAPFGIFFSLVVNPHNSSAQRIESDGEELESMYGVEVADRVPMSIRWFSFALLVVAFAGMVLIPRKRIREIGEGEGEREREEKVEGKGTIDLIEMIENKVFWNLFFMLFTAFSAFSYVQNLYKIIGNIYIQDDHFLSAVGSAAFFFGAGGKAVYSKWFEQFNLRYLMILTYTLYSIFMGSFAFTVGSKGLFSVYIFVLTFLAGSFYSSVILLVNKAFYKDTWVCSYIGIAFIPASLMPYIIAKWIGPEIGYFWTMVLNVSFPILAIFQVVFHPEPKPRIIISSLEELNN